MRSALIALIALSLALPAAAQIKKWVDESGQVHYGDAPPDDAATEEIKVFDNAVSGPRTDNIRPEELDELRRIEAREAYERRRQERQQARDDYRALREEEDKRRQCREFARIESIYTGKPRSNAIRQQRMMGCP